MINESYFCYLSGSSQLQTWLAHKFPDIHTFFVNEMRVATGCAANHRVMGQVLTKLCDVPGGESQLLDFLGEHYPYVLAAPTRPAFSLHRTFRRKLLTIPNRMMLDPDKAPDFVSQQGYAESLTVGDKVYIEYLPRKLLPLLPSIPADRWTLRKLGTPTVYRTEHA